MMLSGNKNFYNQIKHNIIQVTTLKIKCHFKPCTIKPINPCWDVSRFCPYLYAQGAQQHAEL